MTEHVISSITYEDDKYLLKNAVLMSKTFENIIASANDADKGIFYFGAVLPKSWDIPFRIRYRIRCYCSSNLNYNQYADMTYFGCRTTMTYLVHNNIYSTSYRSAYYHNMYRAKTAGVSAGYGHALGFSIYNSTNPTNASYKRTAYVEILEMDNCTFTFYDKCFIYTEIPGTGTTNYDARGDYNWSGNSVYPDSNSDTYNRIRIDARLSTSSEDSVKMYSLCYKRSDETLESLTSTSGNNTTKTWNTDAKIPYPIQLYYYAGSSDIAVNTLLGTSTLYSAISNIDMRYSANVSTTAGFTINKPLYLECSFDTDGFITIGENPYKQTFTKGKYYILIGWVYTNVYTVSLLQDHPMYYYDGSKLISYDKYTYATKDHSHDDATTSTSGFMSSTDKTKLDGIAEGATKTEASTTNGKIKINGTDTTVYTHPTYTSKTSGLYKITVDGTGHVSGATVVAKSDITALGIPGSDTNTTYTLTQDATDGHKLTFTPSSGTATTITIPDNNTTYSAGTGLSLSGTTFNHSNSITAVTTAAFKKFKYDAQGHITGTADVAASDLPDHTHNYVPNTNTGVNTALNLLTAGDGVPSVDNMYVITGHASMSNTTFYRRPISLLWDYFKTKISLTDSGTGAFVKNVTQSNGIFTVTKGDITAADLPAHDHNRILTYPAVNSENRPSNANFATSTNGIGAIFGFIAGGNTSNKPPALSSTIDGNSHIFQMNWDTNAGYDSQFAIYNKNPGISFRTQNAGTWGHWITITANNPSADKVYNLDEFSKTDTTYSAGTGLSLSGTTFNHSNSITAVTTAVFKKFTYDAQGHITGSSAVTSSDLPSHDHSRVVAVSSTTAVPGNVATAGHVLFHYNVNTGLTDNMPTSNNANAIISISKHNGNYTSQLGFSSNGNLYYRSANGETIVGKTWKEIAFVGHSHDNATTSKAGFMSSTDKTKLDGIAEGATKVESSTTNGSITINGTATTVYTHPTYTAKSSGLYKVTVDATGHVSAATAVAKADITALGIPASDTTYSAGTGLSLSGTTFNHSNSITAVTTAGFYKLKYDAQGHITGTTAVAKSDITALGIPSSDTNTTYTIAKGDALGQIKVTPSAGDAYNVTVKGNEAVAYGTCDTAAGTAAKVVTISNNDNWELNTGSIIVIKFSVSNSASNVTLNVNGSGAKSIWYNNAEYTSSGTAVCGYANRYIYYMYDGTYWVWLGHSIDINDNNYDRVRFQQNILAKSAITSSNIIVANDKTGYFHLKTGNQFDITHPILFAGSSIAAAANGNNNYLVIALTITTTQSIAMSIGLPVFIKGSLSGTKFTPISTAPLTQTIPTSDDGYEYILLGFSYSSTGMYLLPDHPIYAYRGGSFAEVSGNSITDLSIDGQTITYTRGDGSTGALTTQDTDTTYSAGTGLSLSGTTFNHSNSVTAVTTAGLYKVKYDAQGHITGTTAVAKSDITGLGIPGSDTNTTYTFASGTTQGAFSVTPSGGTAQSVKIYDLGEVYTTATNHASSTDKDWNNYTTNGWHMAANATNSPDANTSWWIAIVSRHNDKYITQDAWSFTDTANSMAKHYIRRMVNGTWGQWNEVKYTDTTYGAEKGISLTSGNFGHSNTAITASTTAVFKKIAYDAYGHITSTSDVTASDLPSHTHDYVPNTQAGVNAALNLLSVGSSTPSDDDYFISQYANGGTTTTTYHRRSVSKLWDLFKTKISATNSGTGSVVTGVTQSNGAFTITLGEPTVTVTDPTSLSSYGILFAADPNTTERNTLRKNNNFRFKNLLGTASAEGKAELILGNSTAKGTANNETGVLTLYGDSTHWIDLLPASGMTGDRTIRLPDKSGTIALTSDINDTLVKQTVDTSSTTASPILVRANPSAGSATAGEAKYVTNVNVKASTGTLTATEYSVNSKVTMKYDTSIDAVKFVFA